MSVHYIILAIDSYKQIFFFFFLKKQDTCVKVHFGYQIMYALILRRLHNKIMSIQDAHDHWLDQNMY